MKSGFLLHKLSDAPLAPEDSAQDDAAAPASRPQKQPAAKPAAAAAAAAPSPEQFAVALTECLELLRGPTDERRFVGLLLVTKLLPAGDEATIKQVYAAVGPAFLARLLLPLKAGSGGAGAVPLTAEQRQQQAAQCGLGLAVMSSCARVPELAASEELVEKLPLLLNVVRAGGVSQLLAARSASAAGEAGSSPALATDPAADAAAVEDALECAVAVARSGPEGRAVAAESGAVSAAAAALQAAPAGATQQLSLALQLLAAVLGDAGRALVPTGNQAAALAQALPGLARAFALPTKQLSAGAPSGGNSQEEQLAAQRASLAVQLEALHVLLLLLPLPDGIPPPKQLLAPGAAWPAQIARGLALLLRGRISAVQRHSALQLAAAVLDLLGPDWLLGGPWPASSDSGAPPGQPGENGSSSSAGHDSATNGGSSGGSEVDAFFQLLVEVTKVETSVLLHDALAPAIPVPLASAPGAAAADWRPPAPRGGGPGTPSDGSGSAAGSEAGDGVPASVAADLAADLAGSGADVAADVEPLVRVLHSEEERRQMEAQLKREREAAAAAGAGDVPAQRQQGEFMRQVDATPIPTDMRWEGPSEASGQRAARLLPCCFALLEAGVEALALDTQRSEAADAGGSSVEGGSEEPAPALSPAVAHRALLSLQEAVEVVLQFIEQSSLEASSQQGGDGPATRQPLLLAALRVVARFCAEVPDAFGDRLRPLLPFLLPLRVEPDWQVQVAGQQAQQQGDDHYRLPAEGTTFLLPLLLQVSDPAYAAGDSSERLRREQQLWLDALGGADVLPRLLRYASDCAAGCTPAVTTEAAAAADDALIYACQLLIHVLAASTPPEAHLQPGSAAAAKQRQRRRRLLAGGGAGWDLLRRLLQLACMRPVVSPADCKPQQLVHAARLLTTIAAVAAVIAASVAAELRGSTGGGSDSADGLAASLRLSEAELARRVEEEKAEEQRVARYRRHRGLPGVPPVPPQPFLGPISGRQMYFLCGQLLSAMQITVQLACSEVHVRYLMPGATLAGSPVAARLAASRAAVAADAALSRELRRNFDCLACEAAALVRHYAPFGVMCRQDNWVGAELAAAHNKRQAGAAAAVTTSASSGAALEDSPSLQQFLAAVAALP